MPKATLKILGETFASTKSEKTFSELYNRIRPGLMIYVNNIVKDHALTEHIVSAVMTSVYTKIAMYNPKWHISTWIYRIAYTHACGALRSKKSKKSTSMSNFDNDENRSRIDKMEFNSADEFEDHLIKNENDIEQKEKLFVIRKAVDSLPIEYRSIIEDKFFKDLKYKEIAANMQIPLHTVKNRINRGKTLLREALINLNTKK